jgi:prophage maintenance system killer protein
MTTEPKAAIHYLTVQDILWINHEVTGEVLPYKHLQLEEATFGQYGYGGSANVVDQAANFLSAFGRLRPFERGNRGTAFVAVLSFLALNGHQLVLENSRAAAWFEKASGRTADAKAAILNAIAEGGPQPDDIKPAVRTTVRDVIKAYSTTVESLTD